MSVGGLYLLVQGQSQSQSDELGDRVLSCRWMQDQAHLPAPGRHNPLSSFYATKTKTRSICF